MSAIAALLLSLLGTDRLGDPTPPGVMTRYGTTRMCFGNSTGELRFHTTRDEVTLVPMTLSPAVALSPRGWRKDPFDEDADPFPFTDHSADGRRRFTIRFRIDDKADRYRGYPECFVQVFDAVTNRVEARYAFRLDDIGTDELLKPPVKGDGEHVFRYFTLSDDGDLLAWTDHDNRLRVRHLPSGRVITAVGRYDWPSRFLMVFSPNGKRLAVLNHDSIISLIDPHTGRLQTTADNPATAARLAAISPDGKRVATGHACGEVWVWDAATGKPLWHTEPEGSRVRELHFNPTGTTVCAVGSWGSAGVRTFDAKSGKELGPILPYRCEHTLAVSADGKRIVDLIEEKRVMENGGRVSPLFVRTRELASGKELKRVRLDHHFGLLFQNGGIVSRDGRVVVVRHIDGDTIAYDTATGKRKVCLPRSQRRSYLPMSVSDDGRFLLCSHRNLHDDFEDLAVVDLDSKRPEIPTREFMSLEPASLFMIMTPDARYATRMTGAKTELFDLRTGHALVRQTPYTSYFFPNGKSVLTLPGIRGVERVSLEPLAWKVAPPPKPSEARLKQLWAQLGEPAALDAVFELARHSAEAVPFLKSKLLVDPPDPKAVAAHIDRLDSKLYAEREESTKALRAFGPAVLTALRAALKTGPSLEARTRLEKLIAGHANTTSPFTLARLRAVEALERCNTPESCDALKTLANSAHGTPWGDDAAHAVKRLPR